jgi:hypothetical protein
MINPYALEELASELNAQDDYWSEIAYEMRDPVAGSDYEVEAYEAMAVEVEEVSEAEVEEVSEADQAFLDHLNTLEADDFPF